MFLPLIIAAADLAIKAGSAIASHKAQNKASRANEAAANAAAGDALFGLHTRALEERSATAQTLDEGERQAMSSASLARLSAISSGVAGQSADAIVGSVAGDFGRFQTSVKQNLDMTLLQIGRQEKSVEAERQARIVGVPYANPWMTGLAIGEAALDFGNTWQRYHPPKAV